MTTQQPQDDPTRTPAWGTLASLAAGLAGTTIRDLVDDEGGRSAALLAEAAGIHFDYSRQRVTRDVVTALLALADERGVAARRDQMLAGVHINTTEDRAVLHTALRRPASDTLVVDGDDVVAQVNEVLAPDGRLRRGGPRRAVARRDGRAHRGGGERRHRRLRPRPGHGVHRPRGLQPARHRLPVRLQRRSDGHVRGPPRPRPGDHTRDRRVQDLHDPRDDDERPCRPHVARRRARGGRGRAALRRGVDERGEGGRVRHRPGEHVRVLGLGRRALLDGLVHRAEHHDRDRPGGIPPAARRLPRDGRPLRHGRTRRPTCRC